MKNEFTFKSFLHKYNKIFLFVILLVVSFGITIYFAKAANNDDNKYEIKDIEIANIEDGTPNFNSTTDTSGNDSSNNNGVVRTHDSINYSVKYKLSLKAGQTASSSDQRTVVVDVLIPTKVEGTVNGQPLKSIFENYSYAEFEVNADIEDEQKTLSITLSDINASNNTKITPKIYIKEKTDSSKKSINELPEDKKSSYSSATSVEGFPNITTTCKNTIDTTTTCETTVTTKEDYIVNLFKGSSTKNNLITNYKIGYMIGMISDESTGIKGKSLPSNVNFTITSNASIEGTPVDTSKDIITYGTTINQNFVDEVLYMCDNCPEKLEPVTLDDSSNNGTPEITNSSNGNVNISVNNINNKYNALSTNNQYIAFSTGVLEMTSERVDSQVIGDITISLNSGKTGSNTLSLVDKQNKYSGIYRSTINLKDKSSETNKESGVAVLNYNQEFNIENEINYGKTGGDDLEELTSFIKIDNRAIKLINFTDGDSNYSYKAYLNNGSTNNIVPSSDDVNFYYGEWTTDYFELTGASGCPTSLNSSEEIMNLYGGPCVRGKSNLIKYKELILDDKTWTGTPLENKTEYVERGPLIAEFTFKSTDENKIKDVTGLIKLAGRIHNNTTLINNAYQIVSSAKAKFNGSSDYYMSNELNTNGINLITNSNNYVKTVYDFENKKVTSLHTNVCGNNDCAISGNTILVSAVRTSKPTIKTFYNTNEKEDFYYYPIEWDIETSGYTSGGTSSTIVALAVDVYLPNYLRLTSTEGEVTSSKDGEVGTYTRPLEPIKAEAATIEELNQIKHPEDLIDTGYTKYTYLINTVDFDNNIPKLKLYTNIKLDTPKTYSFRGYSTINYYANISVPGTGGIEFKTFETIDPIPNRSNYTDKKITIHNDADVTMQGTLSPRMLEKNESYDYNMQAFNNSSNAVTNASLYFVVPYSQDSSYEDLRSIISASDFKIKFKTALPEGYKAYYNTSGTSSNIISNEVHPELSTENSWVEWNDTTTEISGVIAIKIVKTSDMAPKSYFVNEGGITLQVTPVGSDVGDVYYNQFYVITGTTNKNSYSSSRDRVSIYNRRISGYVWEDYDYNGLFDNEESKLENIPVSLYRISDNLDGIDANDPTTFVGKDGEEWISDTTTDTTGAYSFSGLTEGKYYVKYTYDDKKYVITKRDASNADGTPASSINSKARSYSGGNVAISSIVTFDKLNNSSYDILNLGLSIRKEFSVDVKNYIKNVTINSSSGTDSYDYDKATTVTISLKNTRNKTARVTYDFVVENTKYFPGYVGLIQDIMPSGMTFNSNLKENQDWVLSGGVLYYTGLSGKLLVPNEKYYFSLVLDMEITEGGNYVNFVSLDNLVLMGDEIPEFDFTNVDTNSSQEGTNNSSSTTGEGE